MADRERFLAGKELEEFTAPRLLGPASGTERMYAVASQEALIRKGPGKEHMPTGFLRLGMRFLARREGYWLRLCPQRIAPPLASPSAAGLEVHAEESLWVEAVEPTLRNLVANRGRGHPMSLRHSVIVGGNGLFMFHSTHWSIGQMKGMSTKFVTEYAALCPNNWRFWWLSRFEAAEQIASNADWPSMYHINVKAGHRCVELTAWRRGLAMIRLIARGFELFFPSTWGFDERCGGSGALDESPPTTPEDQLSSNATAMTPYAKCLSMQRSARNEWNDVARQLASASFHVLIPDLHSAPEALRPGKLTGEVLRELFARTLCSRNRMIPARYHSVIRPKAIVMGASWGAGMAAEVAALDDVVAVAMVSPLIGEELSLRPLLQNIQGRVAVALTNSLMTEDGEVRLAEECQFREVELKSCKTDTNSARRRHDVQWIESCLSMAASFNGSDRQIQKGTQACRLSSEQACCGSTCSVLVRVIALTPARGKKRQPDELDVGHSDGMETKDEGAQLQERRLKLSCVSQELPLSITMVMEVSAPGMGRYGLAGNLWPAGRLLAELLLRPLVLGQELAALLSESTRVLELGAGLALPSVCLSCVGHDCLATDLPQVLPVPEANAAANAEVIQLGGGKLAVLPLIFGDDGKAEELVGHFDLVIAADVCYDPVLYEPLLATLRSLSFGHFVVAVVQRPDLGEETFENFCKDEGIALQLRYTALPPVADGGAAHRINIYDLASADLLQREGKSSCNIRCFGTLKKPASEVK
ncbi:EEF1AKMT3 [Symbiodinium natans]|uniref:EEF1AKMT3 protein n=1 Tax=Symbiodinium natans TaxID=878477 RepID=A0A812SCX6_9DINO|nr:EEF1AKMT3 [Symbiodinium natans]